MTISSLIIAAALVLASLSACTPQPLRVTREPSALRLAGADSCATLVTDAASAYEASRPWVAVTSEVFNNALAMTALLREGTDVALLSWRPVNGEGADLLWTEPFARDGLAVIVHPESGFSEIGLAELRDIFLGRLQEREGVVLTVVSREEGSGTRAAFERMVLDGEDTTLNAVVTPSSSAMVAYVGSHRSAVGYVSTNRLDERVRALPVEGVVPSGQAIATGDYPLWRQLYVASAGEPTGEARQFAQWLLRGGGDIGLARGRLAGR